MAAKISELIPTAQTQMNRNRCTLASIQLKVNFGSYGASNKRTKRTKQTLLTE